MSLIVEDGSAASASANTYISDDYFTGFCSDLGLTISTYATADRETAILRAMDWIESQSFKGSKEDKENPLLWPRSGADDGEFSIDEDEIPKALKKALARAAYEELLEAGCLAPTLSDNIKREKIDIIETEYFSANASSKDYAAIQNYLRPILLGGKSGKGVVNLLRC
jgi:hypothetical protein